MAVMSYHIWQDKYGSDPSVVGARLPDQRASVHSDRGGPAGIFRSEAGWMGHAGLLVAAHERAAD